MRPSSTVGGDPTDFVQTRSNGFQITIAPPYDACVGESLLTSVSPPAGSDEILEKGFSNASYSCDAERGVINNTIVLFGGKEGSILEPPNYEADVSSGMEFGFTPYFTGDLRMNVTMSVNANTGAAAGSAAALLDLRDVILEFLLPSQIGAFILIAEGLIFQTASGVKTEAYLYVDTETSREDTAILVGGHGFGASFPIPPHSQGAELDSEEVKMSLTVPVIQGERIYIGTGIKTTALVHGWAVAYWNPANNQETSVVSVVLTEVSFTRNDSTLINSGGFIVLQPGQTSDMIFDVQNTGSSTWMPRNDYVLLNTNGVSLGAYPVQVLINEIQPGEIAQWVVPVIAPPQIGLNRTEWQMAYDGDPFGAKASCLVAVVPEGEIDIDIAALLEQWLEELQKEIEDRFDQFLQDLADRFEEWLQQESERLLSELLESLSQQCCGAAMIAPGFLLLVVWTSGHRRRKRMGDRDRE